MHDCCDGPDKNRIINETPASIHAHQQRAYTFAQDKERERDTPRKPRGTSAHGSTTYDGPDHFTIPTAQEVGVVEWRSDNYVDKDEHIPAFLAPCVHFGPTRTNLLFPRRKAISICEQPFPVHTQFISHDCQRARCFSQHCTCFQRQRDTPIRNSTWYASLSSPSYNQRFAVRYCGLVSRRSTNETVVTILHVIPK